MSILYLPLVVYMYVKPKYLHGLEDICSVDNFVQHLAIAGDGSCEGMRRLVSTRCKEREFTDVAICTTGECELRCIYACVVASHVHNMGVNKRKIEQAIHSLALLYVIEPTP